MSREEVFSIQLSTVDRIKRAGSETPDDIIEFFHEIMENADQLCPETYWDYKYGKDAALS